MMRFRWLRIFSVLALTAVVGWLTVASGLYLAQIPKFRYSFVQGCCVPSLRMDEHRNEMGNHHAEKGIHYIQKAISAALRLRLGWHARATPLICRCWQIFEFARRPDKATAMLLSADHGGLDNLITLNGHYDSCCAINWMNRFRKSPTYIFQKSPNGRTATASGICGRPGQLSARQLRPRR